MPTIHAPERPILKVASLFAGAGGMDLGFHGGFTHLGVSYEELPYRVVWANDIDKDAGATYTANNGHQCFIQGDIYDQDPTMVPDFDVLLAGFPCQPFSNAGKRLGVSDPRGTLFEEVERFVRAKAPIAFVLENVKGILSSKMPDGTSIVDEIRQRLKFVRTSDHRELHYLIPPAVLLKAESFGVPQQRHRVFIVGIRQDVNDRLFNFSNLHSFVKAESLQKLTLRSVLSDLPSHLPNYNDVWPLSPLQLRLAQHIRRSWKDIPDEHLTERFLRIRNQPKKYRSPNFFRRFGMDEVNGTITASAQPENCGILHPMENRRFSVREIARIQSFPDDYRFLASTTAGKYKVIGNAVPPVLAWVLAAGLYTHIFSKGQLVGGVGSVEAFEI